MSKIYYIFAKDIHIPPSELDNMFWYDIIYILKEHQNLIEKENEDYERQEKEYEEKYKFEQPEMPKFEQPKMPDFGNLKFN